MRVGNPYTVLRVKWTLLTRNSATKVTLNLFLSLYLSLSPATTFNPLTSLHSDRPFCYIHISIFRFHIFISTTLTSTTHHLFSPPLLTTASHHCFSLLITVTGRHVFMGYMYMPDKSAETIDEDGTGTLFLSVSLLPSLPSSSPTMPPSYHACLLPSSLPHSRPLPFPLSSPSLSTSPLSLFYFPPFPPANSTFFFFPFHVLPYFPHHLRFNPLHASCLHFDSSSLHCLDSLLILHYLSGFLHSGDVAELDADNDPLVPAPSGFMKVIRYAALRCHYLSHCHCNSLYLIVSLTLTLAVP